MPPEMRKRTQIGMWAREMDCTSRDLSRK
jgi:hypothetical protein